MTYINQIKITEPTTPFNDLRVSEKTPLIEIVPFGTSISSLRNTTTTTGSATISLANSEYSLTTTASSSDSADLQSSEHGRYFPGYSAECGVGMRIPSSTTFSGTANVRWGYFDDDDGFGFGVDSGGIFIFVYRNGTEEVKVYQSSWNVNKVDGSDGLTLDITRGNIYEIEYVWYGYGQISFSVNLSAGEELKTAPVVLHRYRPVNTVSVEEPHLPIRVKLDNGNSGIARSVYVGGRQYSINGRYRPNTRITSEYKLQKGSIGTTFLPLISFRRKSTFSDYSIIVDSFDIISDADILIQIRLGSTLTSPSWGSLTDHSANETSLESDTSANAISGGDVLWQGLGKASTKNSGSVIAQDVFFQDFVGTQPVTLCVRRVTGSNATVDAVFRTREEW